MERLRATKSHSHLVKVNKSPFERTMYRLNPFSPEKTPQKNLRTIPLNMIEKGATPNLSPMRKVEEKSPVKSVQLSLKTMDCIKVCNICCDDFLPE